MSKIEYHGHLAQGLPVSQYINPEAQHFLVTAVLLLVEKESCLYDQSVSGPFLPKI